MELRSGVFVNFIMSGRCKTKEDYAHLKEVNPYPPRFGRNWWTWKPLLKTNFRLKKDTITLFQFTWFCFTLDYTDFNKARKLC